MRDRSVICIGLRVIQEFGLSIFGLSPRYLYFDSLTVTRDRCAYSDPGLEVRAPLPPLTFSTFHAKRRT